MVRVLLLIATGVSLACLLAGCATPDLTDLLPSPTGPVNAERVLAVKLERASEAAQDALRKLGLKAVVTPLGDRVEIVSATSAGVRFRLALSREHAVAGERTRVRLTWLDERGDPAGSNILAHVEKAAVE